MSVRVTERLIGDVVIASGLPGSALDRAEPPKTVSQEKKPAGRGKKPAK